MNPVEKRIIAKYMALCVFVLAVYGFYIDYSLSRPGGRPHVEVMLDEPSPLHPSHNPNLKIGLKLSVEPDVDVVGIEYIIENLADSPTTLDGRLGIAILEITDKHEPGRTALGPVDLNQSNGFTKVVIPPRSKWKTKIAIERDQIGCQDVRNGSFFVDAYYEEELVARYKVLTGYMK